MKLYYSTILNSIYSLIICLVLLSPPFSKGAILKKEAEDFTVKEKISINKIQKIDCVSFTNTKEGKIETEFTLPKAGRIDIWVRIWIEWEDHVIKVSIDGRTPKPSWINLPEDLNVKARERWDMDNVEVWHWRRIPMENLTAGKHTLTITSKSGLEFPPALDKIAIAYSDSSAWKEEWLTGEMASLSEKPVTTMVEDKVTVVQAELLKYKNECRIKNIGEAGKSVVLEKPDAILGGTVECVKAGDYDIWIRVYYECENSFEAPVLHEFSYAIYFALNGDTKRTVYQTDQRHWRWEYLCRTHIEKGKNLIHFWMSPLSHPVEIDRIVFSKNEAPWGQDWFEKDYAHFLPFGIENTIPYDSAPIISGWRIFGNLAEEAQGKIIQKSLDGLEIHPFELMLPATEGKIIMEQPKPFKSNEALSITDPESQIELAIRGDGSGVNFDAIIRDNSGEYFKLLLTEKVDWKGWQVVSSAIPRNNANTHENGNNNGIPDYPVELTQLIITKGIGISSLAFGEPAFTSPFKTHATFKGIKNKTFKFEINITNTSNTDGKALLYYGLNKIKSGNKKTSLKKSVSLNIPANKSASTTITLPTENYGIYALNYAIGPGTIRKFYCMLEKTAGKSLAALITAKEQENGAFRLKVPINGVKRKDVAIKYGRVKGLTIMADGKDITSRAYADKVGYRYKLQPKGMDLSDEAGWPEIHVAPGTVGIDPIIGRVKFAEGDKNPPARAAYMITGFGVPAMAPPQLHGDYLFMHVGEADIPIVDIRNPKDLNITGYIENWYFSYKHYFYRDIGYFHSEHRTLNMVDNISNPYRPGKIRSVNLRMDKYGKLLYIFEKSGVGIAYTKKGYIMDLSDPFNPRPIGRHKIGEHPYITSNEIRTYTKKDNKILVWDTSNPRSPKKIAEFGDGGTIIGVDGKYLLNRKDSVFTVYEGLDKPVVKCQIKFNGEKPSYLDSREGGMGGGGIFNEHVYIVDCRQKFSQGYSYGPKSPHSRIYTYNLNGKLVDIYEDPQPSEYTFWTVDHKRKVAYVNDGTGRIIAFDLSNPAKPRMSDWILSSDEVRFGYTTPKGISWHGQYFGGGIFATDVSNPYHPKRAGEFYDGNFNVQNYSICGYDKIVYLPRGGESADQREIAGVAILDSKNPLKLNQVGRLPDGYPYVMDDRLYLITGPGTKKEANQLRIYDLADPSKPRELGRIENAGEAVIGIREGKAYTMSSDKLMIFDVTNPAAIKKLGEIKDKEHIGNMFHNVQHAGISRKGYIYVSQMESYKIPISIFDVRNPTKIRYVKTLDNLVNHRDTISTSWGDQTLGACELVGDYFFVPRYGCQIDVYDISKPENPSFASKSICGMTWQAGNQVGDFLFVPTIEGMWITDVPSSSQAPNAVSNR